MIRFKDFLSEEIDFDFNDTEEVDEKTKIIKEITDILAHRKDIGAVVNKSGYNDIYEKMFDTLQDTFTDTDYGDLVKLKKVLEMEKQKDELLHDIRPLYTQAVGAVMRMMLTDIFR